MPNRVTNTGIVSKSYNSRGLITHRASTTNLLRETDGTLWVAVRENQPSDWINLYKSINNGFSWTRIWSGNFTNPGFRTTSQASLNQNGPFMSLQIFENRSRLVLWHTYFDSGTSDYDIQPFVFNSETGEQILYDADDPDNNMPVQDKVALDADQLAAKVVYSDLASFIVYTRASALRITAFQAAYYTGPAGSASLAGTYFNIFDAVTHKNNFVDIAILRDNTSSYSLMHIRYNANGSTFSTPVQIYNTPNTSNIISDVNIRRDGLGNMMVCWGETNGTEILLKYSISRDNGVNWDAPITINPTAGQSSFTDAPTGQLATRAVLLGGLVGFVIGYTRKTSDGTIKSFVRKLDTTNGTDYTLGDERQVCTASEKPTANITGIKFFEPPNIRLLDITDPGIIRIGYQVGEGNSTTAQDTIPVKFGQELLSESAYQTTLASDLTGYQTDPTSSNQILVEVNVMAGPSNNVDYYASGVRGALTDRYMAAFRKAGTELRVLRYDPNPNAAMDDRSAYYAPIEYVSLAVFTPMSYGFPFPQSNESVTTFVERDARKIHLPPDFWLEREFILNDGNFLKRTVWTVLYDGNEYELSQVVPNIVRNQICHYTANAYVVGPGNNPFARVVLPSET